MGIRLKIGRFFDEHDGRGDNRVVVANETFVRTFWARGTNPLASESGGRNSRSG